MSTTVDTPSVDGPTAGLWRRLSPRAERAFHCRCGRPVFFGNTRCVACGSELGFDPSRHRVVPIERTEAGGEATSTQDPAGEALAWRAVGESAPLYRLCANRDSAVACNWLIDALEAERFTQC